MKFSSKFFVVVIILVILIMPPRRLSLKAEEEFLGEFVRGRDTIRISGRLVIEENGSDIPIAHAKVYLYMNISESESMLLYDNTTDSNGSFLFCFLVDERFPLGEVLFMVYYPGSLYEGIAPARMYYRAVIKGEQKEGLGAILVVVLLFMMMLSSALVSLRRMFARKYRARGMPVWKEILNTMTEQARKKDVNFVLLIRELVDSISKELGILPKPGATLQEKVSALREMLPDDALNIIKNIIAVHDLLTYGGPYARTILISTMDFDTWVALLSDLTDVLDKRLGG